MLNKSPSFSGSAPQGSPLTKCLSMLGTAGGIAASIMLTPLLFSLMEHWLSGYLESTWGGLGSILLLGMWGVIAVTVFALGKILILGGLTAALVSLASRTSGYSA